jgi:hypothetical protein
VAFGPRRRGGSGPVDGRASFFSFIRVNVWWGGAQVVAATSSPIRSPRLQPISATMLGSLWGVLWFSRTFSARGEGLRTSWSFTDGYSSMLISRTDVVFLTSSVTLHSHPTMSGRLREERQRDIDTVWRLKTKYILRIWL